MKNNRAARLSRAMTVQLIRQLVEGRHSPVDVAGEKDLPLERLAEWARDPANISILQSLARLSDVHTQMLLSRYRANAALHLLKIATAKDPTELSRKACVDLLKANLNVFPQHEHGDEPPPMNEKAIIAALEELGREADDA